MAYLEDDMTCVGLASIIMIDLRHDNNKLPATLCMTASF